jgi:two-component system chemotaxis response regulator CheB
MIADPDPTRRHHIMSRLDNVTVIEAASMTQAFDLSESMQPHAVALSAELSGDAGLGMFLHLIDARSVSILIYGRASRNQTQAKFGKMVPFQEYSGLRDEADLIRSITALLTSGKVLRVAETRKPAAGRKGTQPDLIVIGASTGGVSALEILLSRFPVDCPPTLVVQHIRPGFIDGMIRRLDQRCAPEVRAAADAGCPQPGQICVAADTDRHLVLQTGAPLRCRLKVAEPRHGHRPSVDALFESAAGRPSVAAALLTGMGADGAEGMAKIRSAGGFTVAQDEATCVVYGMPRVAVEMGAASLVLPLEQIAPALLGQRSIKSSGRREESVR